MKRSLMCRLHVWLSALPVLLTVYALPAAATEIGSFTASQACEAYISKNIESNPDNVRVQSGARYEVEEVLGSKDAPRWVRVRVPGLSPSISKRWVSAQCGNFAAISGGGSACSTPGLGDSYVFAVSWQATFCEGHPNKPECSMPDRRGSYAAKNFTLHGLWPNKNSCGINYGYCGQEKQTNFCSYSEPKISAPVYERLVEVMPSAEAGSCLQRHEWYKHGTCQTKWDPSGYFAVSISLTYQFNNSGIARFMQSNMGKKVRTADFLRVVDESLGEGASKRLRLTCERGALADVYMTLPPNLPNLPNLSELLLQGPPAFSSNCGEDFEVRRTL